MSTNGQPTLEELKDLGIPIPKQIIEQVAEKKEELKEEAKPEIKKDEGKPEISPEDAKLAELRTSLEETKKELAALRAAKEAKIEEVKKVEEKPKFQRRATLSDEEAEAVALGGPEGARVINNLVEKIYADVVDQTVPRFIEEIERSVAPMQRISAEIEVAKRTQEFITKYSDLKDDLDVCQEVAVRMIEEKRQFKDWDDFYSSVATEAKPKIQALRQKYGGSQQEQQVVTETKTDVDKSTVRKASSGLKLSEEQQQMANLIKSARSR